VLLILGADPIAVFPSLLRGHAGLPAIYLYGVFPKELSVCLDALLGNILPDDPQAVANKISGMLADRPVAAVEKTVFSEDLP
jgi:hypothetical protein